MPYLLDHDAAGKVSGRGPRELTLGGNLRLNSGWGWVLNKRLSVFFVGLMVASTAVVLAQKPGASALGKWKGESLCTVKPSACHDEVVVYEFTASTEKKGMLSWKADKIVNGEQQNMGTLDCTFASGTQTVTCNIPRGVWELQVNGDTMTGTLKLSDGTLFRKVSVKRM